MATASYPSLRNAEVVEVEFVTAQGESFLRRLLVDSGFTGESGVILGQEDIELVKAPISAVETVGALQGSQDRGWVTCRIPALGFQRPFIAIVTDIKPLSLPAGVQGLAGLTFLRQFARWGSERTPHGWRFCLVTD